MNALDYFQSHGKYFWIWEENAQVLAIPGGNTIAFTDEMTVILLKMAQNGLPPFGAVLLSMIAINKTDDDALDFVYELFSKLDLNDSIKQNYLEKAFNFLNRLHSMPIEYRTGQRKQILLQTIFENAHNRINVPTSRGIVQYLLKKEGRSRISKLAVLPEYVVEKSLHVLELLDRKFTTIESIIDAMGDLPEIEEALIPSLDTKSISSVDYKDFVEELMDDAQTFQIGALVKSIWAGFKVPIFNAHPSEQPLGGISDLSNRGDFDKLLVAEFANDDLIFMSRLANNEALYLHREMPPVTDKLQRVILIDISLKTWGVPKILAHATSLAISKHPKSQTENQVFVVGNDCIPIEYENKGTIIDGLQKVSASLNAGSGIASFLKENRLNKQLEIFYITTPDGLKYPEISKLLSENHALFKYIITTTIGGDIQFYKNKNNAFKHLQTLTLPLERLWTKPLEKPLEKIENKIYTVIPSNEQLPILLPIPNRKSGVIPLGQEIYFVSNKCLYRRVQLTMTHSYKGAELILQNVPHNGIYEIGRTAQGQLLFFSFNPHDREVVITDLTTLQYAKASFIQWRSFRYHHFIFIRERFTFLVSNPTVYTFTPNFETNIIEIKEDKYDSNVFFHDYAERKKLIDDSKNTFSYSSFNFLKNLKEVYINQANLLTFNLHSLERNPSASICFRNYISKAGIIKKVKAEYNSSEKAFVFSDGSKIKANSKGYFELTSSNKKIPTICIPSTIDIAVGAATNDHFAGNEYFYKVPFLTFKLNSVGVEKIKVIKTIHNFTSFGLDRAKQIIDETPSQFSVYSNIKDADKLIKELRNLGCEIEFSSNTKEQTIISTQEFYNSFIQEFINQILSK